MEIYKSPLCRKKGETKKQCVSRKVSEIMHERPDVKQDQAVAIAESVCSKTCKMISEKYMTRETIKKLMSTDYLTLQEISKRAVKQVRPDLLFRTHVAVHQQAKTDDSKKVIKAHKIVADELVARGFFHHQWDKLDTIYHN